MNKRHFVTTRNMINWKWHSAPSTGDPMIGSCPEGLKSHVFPKEVVKQACLTAIIQLLFTNFRTAYGPSIVVRYKHKLYRHLKWQMDSMESGCKKMLITNDINDELTFLASHYEVMCSFICSKWITNYMCNVWYGNRTKLSALRGDLFSPNCTKQINKRIITGMIPLGVMVAKTKSISFLQHNALQWKESLYPNVRFKLSGICFQWRERLVGNSTQSRPHTLLVLCLYPILCLYADFSLPFLFSRRVFSTNQWQNL